MFTNLDQTIHEIGKGLMTRAQERSPGLLNHRWWTDLLLDLGTRDEEFKVQLFRFIDVLPTLKSDAQFIQLLEEYFEDITILPAPLRWLLKHLSDNPLSSHLSALVLRKQFLTMAETFMAGHTVKDAVPVLRRLWEDGCAFSVDLLGEAIVSEAEADVYRDRCLHTLSVLGRETRRWPTRPILERDHLGPLPRVQLSVKFSALYSQLDPLDPEGSYQGVGARLRPILDLAASMPASIIVDMEQAELKYLTLDIFTRMFSEAPYSTFPHAGIALQAYLKDARATLEDLITWTRNRGTPISIRLVKGAYWDSEVVQYRQKGWPVPVFLRKAETDANFEALAHMLLEHPSLIRPAFGSHNIRTLAHAQALAVHHAYAPETCEYQMLYGMADSLRQAIVDSGLRMRVYTPLGELIPGMAYLVRRLLENTSSAGFIRRQFEAAVSLEHVLASPYELGNELGQREQTSDLARLHAPQDQPVPLEPFANEPHTDFSRPGAFTPFAHALQDVKTRLGNLQAYPLVTKRAPSGTVWVTRNPSFPEEIIARFQAVALDDLPPIVDRAQAHFPMWKTTSAQARADLLFRTAALIRTRHAELAAWEVLETGKPWREADADVTEAIDFLEYYGRQMLRLGSPSRLGHAPGELNHLIWQPRGLAAVISPWNFSLAIPTGMVSAALVSGNVVLFKPSERSLMMGYLLYTLFQEAGVPEGVIHFLPGGPEVGRALAANPQIDVIAFTGSKNAGLHILQEAHKSRSGQRHVTHVIAEMGGKNAIIVDETADLDEAVLGVVTSATGYQGQKCSACSRVIVLSSIYKNFLDRLSQAALSLRIGPPEDPANRMGPLIDQRAFNHVRDYIDRGKREGDCVLDRQMSSVGFFQGPAIFTGLGPDHPLVQEEIFGPVITVHQADTIADALGLANQSVYALTGGVYSRSPANIHSVCQAFDVGNLYINRPITGSLVGRQPFGGHRLSGIGRKAGGPGYVEQFMVEKVITENTLRRGFAPTQ